LVKGLFKLDRGKVKVKGQRLKQGSFSLRQLPDQPEVGREDGVKDKVKGIMDNGKESRMQNAECRLQDSV
jgi:hypothetical protein